MEFSSSSASTWAVVVARVGPGAKSRLSTALDQAQRTQLALAMLADVVQVCARSGLGGTIAVVDTPTAQAVAEGQGALAIADPGRGDMNAAVSAGIHSARRRGAATVLVVPGDIPLLQPADLRSLLYAAGNAPRAVVIGASRDGQGTNALLLRPPDVIAPLFGPPSVDRHLRTGRAAGALSLVRHNLGLALDVDTPGDLAALVASAHSASHTARALAQLLRVHSLAL